MERAFRTVDAMRIAEERSPLIPKGVASRDRPAPSDYQPIGRPDTRARTLPTRESEPQTARSSGLHDPQSPRCSERGALTVCRSGALVGSDVTTTLDDLPDRLAQKARTLGRDVVRRRLVPVFKLPFYVAQRLQRVTGVLPAFEVDPRVIQAAVSEFCRLLHENPHDQYDRDFTPAGAEAFWIEVCDAWGKVREPGSDMLVAAFRRAERYPIVLLPPADVYGPRFVLVLSVAYHLQCDQGNEPIFLPVEPLGVLMGIDRTTVGAVLNLGRRLNLLHEVEPPQFTKGKARTVRFVRESHLYCPPTGDGVVPAREPGEDDA